MTSLWLFCLRQKVNIVFSQKKPWISCDVIVVFILFQDATCCIWNYSGNVLHKFKGHKVGNIDDKTLL